ncbi:MAG: TRAM domain-containing protein [bacterium]|nr:TRAM domain-containing protein [bacterium]
MAKQKTSHSLFFPPRLVSALADEVAKRMRRKKQSPWKTKKTENAVFLDTSAIIDGRILDVIQLGFLSGSTIVVLQSILLELKHIADSRDSTKRERGRRGLELLEETKKTKGIKLMVVSDEETNTVSYKEVDEKLIKAAKVKKGRIVTCDYNLAKKASVEGVLALNINTLANVLKIRALPGESFTIKILHKGKEQDQGVGYLDDGTMIVVEGASYSIGETISVIVSRVIQTAAGRILFAKKLNTVLN